MKGFICDRCGQRQDGKPNGWAGNLNYLEPELKHFVKLSLDTFPVLDLCEKCKREIAKKILE